MPQDKIESSSALLPAHIIESAGVDWITCTAPRARAHEEFYEVGKSLVEDAARLGNDVSNWQGQGYHGVRAAGVRVGLRYDTFICQLSSDDARDNWKRVHALASNVSRLDLQVTYRFKRAQPKFFRDEHRRAVAGRGGKGRKSNVTLITSTLQGDSIYLGQRSSDVYARCYDKGMESKEAPAGSLIRHEIELKRDVARRTSDRLSLSPSDSLLSVALVSRHMSGKHLRTSGLDDSNPQIARARQITDNVRRKRWLHSAVRPSVEVLLAAGEVEAVLDCLGLREAVEALCASGQLKRRKESKGHGR